MDKYYTPEQAAEILLVRPRTIRQWLRDGIILGQKISNQWRISHNDLQKFALRREGEKDQPINPQNINVIDIPKPDKHSSDSDWERYGLKLFTEMRKEGIDNHFKGIYITGDTQEQYKGYEYKGQSFKIFMSADEMRIVIERPIEFTIQEGLPEGFEVFGFDTTADVIIYYRRKTEFNQQYINDSRRTKG